MVGGERGGSLNNGRRPGIFRCRGEPKILCWSIYEEEYLRSGWVKLQAGKMSIGRPWQSRSPISHCKGGVPEESHSLPTCSATIQNLNRLFSDRNRI